MPTPGDTASVRGSASMGTRRTGIGPTERTRWTPADPSFGLAGISSGHRISYGSRPRSWATTWLHGLTSGSSTSPGAEACRTESLSIWGSSTRCGSPERIPVGRGSTPSSSPFRTGTVPGCPATSSNRSRPPAPPRFAGRTGAIPRTTSTSSTASIRPRPGRR
jgi:hypothetical protein